MALPSGYTRLAYIQSSGTQYIDTGFKPNNNTRVVMDVEVLSSTANPCALFGARTSATSNNYSFMWTNSVLRSDYNNVYTQTWDVTYTTRRVIDKNKETTTVDGTSKSYTNATFQAPVSLALFALNNNGTKQWYTSAKLYSCQVYDNGTLVRDYIPAKNSAGTLGLYDQVNAKFYTNAGTGTFTGEEITPGSDHLTLVDGTVWGVVGGRCLVGGTGYDIKGGRTLVGGTAYDVSFGEPVTVNVSLLSDYGGHNTAHAHAVINGVTYTGIQTGLQVMPGDVIQFYVGSDMNYTSKIKINGSVVASGNSGATYDWTVPDGVKSISVELFHHLLSIYDGYTNATIFVNTSEKTSANVTITGSGNSSYCYVIINGTKYTSATSGIVVQHGDVITVLTTGDAEGVGAFVDKTENVYLSTEGVTQLCTTSWYVPSVSNITFNLTYATFSGKCGQVYVYKS